VAGEVRGVLLCGEYFFDRSPGVHAGGQCCSRVQQNDGREASQWDIVKAALMAEYAMPKQEAWRKFVSTRMEGLDRFGRRVGQSEVALVVTKG